MMLYFGVAFSKPVAPVLRQDDLLCSAHRPTLVVPRFDDVARVLETVLLPISLHPSLFSATFAIRSDE